MAEQDMQADIGYIAGKIWRILNTKGQCKIRELPRALGAERELVCMGLGWLAREDKLVFGKQGNHETVALKK